MNWKLLTLDDINCICHFIMIQKLQTVGGSDFSNVMICCFVSCSSKVNIFWVLERWYKSSNLKRSAWAPGNCDGHLFLLFSHVLLNK